jgi:hypothetical protein
MARPRIDIDYAKFTRLCEIQCTKEEIAHVLGCSADTISRALKRDKSMSFADYYKKHSVVGKIALRRYQFNLAKKSVPMCIWLGKQYLGQSDIPMVDETELTSGFDVTEIVTADNAN